jgi:alanine-alpha-ketoisovalerate/valine-pyruvate aminotransferase
MRPGRNGGTLKTGGNNGGGRPPKLPEIDKLLADVLGEEKDGVTAADAILRKLRAMAAAGNIRAAEILLDRAYGKAKQPVDMNITTVDVEFTG